ncbi:hypothetical protein BGW36DRAFT_93552 [Talaromyces proteolyticus]|uniref:HMA domain-containing protein n=1 Tax=Talaromyces proteolyticus TaxID=1131652 RepID=A0AAD4Q540_9EURO|nr:uncharacterized protein BGW36DRAFT_93552 [Talaromyces proteolyticus]KAH8703896.1 hypothetical protein BGW36DRAFT_93552 [Talaromyces proteolyticus]
MAQNQYKFGVQMRCSGCSRTIEDAISGVDDLKTLDVSLEHKSVLVTVRPSLSYEEVLTIIKETGKNVRSGEANGQARGFESIIWGREAQLSFLMTFLLFYMSVRCF